MESSGISSNAFMAISIIMTIVVLINLAGLLLSDFAVLFKLYKTQTNNFYYTLLFKPLAQILVIRIICMLIAYGLMSILTFMAPYIPSYTLMPAINFFIALGFIFLFHFVVWCIFNQRFFNHQMTKSQILKATLLNTVFYIFLNIILSQLIKSLLLN